MNTYTDHLAKKKSRNAQAIKDHEDKDGRSTDAPAELKYPPNVDVFMSIMSGAQSTVDAARKYQRAAVRLLNPKVEVPVKIHCYPLSKYDKTTKLGMKQVFADVMVQLQMV